MATSEPTKRICYKYVVIGGGIAGVTCAETLSTLDSAGNILLVTASPLIKAVTNFRKLTKTLEVFDVEERPMFELNSQCPNVTVVHSYVKQLDTGQKIIICEDGSMYSYSFICVCTGGTPKVIEKENPFIIGIRDTETVKEFQKRLTNAKRILIVGNGGIATELCYEIEGCEIIWAVKDKTITHTFVDGAAAEFFLSSLNDDKRPKALMKRTKYKLEDDVNTSRRGDALGSALGPDWAEGIAMKGIQEKENKAHIEYQVEVKRLISPEKLKNEGLTQSVFQPAGQESGSLTTSPIVEWPVYVQLTNDKIFGCDFVVSATGVVPATGVFVSNNKFDVSEDGALLVNNRMQTNISCVYAAGDVCHANWDLSQMWIQMRLWSQARQMGHYAAKCMVAESEGEAIDMDFCFELFAHVTKFFNYKVVLLGKFNAQSLGQNYELLVRLTKGVEYVKVVMREGRMMGAILIGDTDMEETFENLILNQMDLSQFGEDLLNPNIDIDDFFD